ncbi:MAG: hypothetical protein WKF58_02200 [Ilumatobacteraceae bacterium]
MAARRARCAAGGCSRSSSTPRRCSRLLVRALTPGALADTLGDSDTWRVVWFTTWQAVLSTVLTIVIGLAPAHVCARYRFAGRRLLVGLLTGVFVLPTVVMGAAMLAVLPDSMERTVWAILAAHVLFNLAVVVRAVGAVWEHLPRGSSTRRRRSVRRPGRWRVT